jgi:hypothetical protein
LYADFNLLVYCTTFASCDADFSDPTLTDIEISDPASVLSTK